MNKAQIYWSGKEPMWNGMEFELHDEEHEDAREKSGGGIQGTAWIETPDGEKSSVYQGTLSDKWYVPLYGKIIEVSFVEFINDRMNG